jgi:endoribonuclease Dicer
MGALVTDEPEYPPSLTNEATTPQAGDADDNDSGAEEDVLPPGAPITLVEKRRLQKAIFEHWITTPACQEALKPKHKDGKTKGIEDEEQSIHSLLAQQQKGVQIVKNPREYQIELFERAKKENTIAVLDTGSGKTLIAVLLLRWVIDNELESRAAGKSAQVSFFLVSSVTLVYQQFSVLECNLDHKVARLCGADNIDRYNKAAWEKLFFENKVIVCTAEILFQCLSRSYITMKQINLLIFDEAHHAKQNHPFARFANTRFAPLQTC